MVPSLYKSQVCRGIFIIVLTQHLWVSPDQMTSGAICALLSVFITLLVTLPAKLLPQLSVVILRV